jgi:hypothetical protein
MANASGENGPAKEESIARNFRLKRGESDEKSAQNLRRKPKGAENPSRRVRDLLGRQPGRCKN